MIISFSLARVAVGPLDLMLVDNPIEAEGPRRNKYEKELRRFVGTVDY